VRRPPDRRRGPGGSTTTHQGPSVEIRHDTDTRSVQRDPVPLAQAVAELVERSNLLDLSLKLRLAAWREGYSHGYERGVDDGRRQAEAEAERAWYQATHPIAIGGIGHDELERRRWGPCGRAQAGDPRPGDYPGQDGAA
jgi:hypothetical protein